jgi:uncharacterized protein (TIGR00730 family)
VLFIYLLEVNAETRPAALPDRYFCLTVMPVLHSIALFCGSSSGFDSIYKSTAQTVGATIAQRGIRLVYGGSKMGLMGAAADGALGAGGDVIGVLPGFLQTKEIAHPDLTELVIVDTMHERKLAMHRLSDAIIALPGGWGTMEELTEMLTWAQLGLHQKPIGLLNVDGFYDSLVQFVISMQGQGFLRPEHAAMLLVKDDINDLLAAMEVYKAPPVPKWVTESRT